MNLELEVRGHSRFLLSCRDSGLDLSDGLVGSSDDLFGYHGDLRRPESLALASADDAALSVKDQVCVFHVPPVDLKWAGVCPDCALEAFEIRSCYFGALAGVKGHLHGDYIPGSLITFLGVEGSELQGDPESSREGSLLEGKARIFGSEQRCTSFHDGFVPVLDSIISISWE